MQSRQEEINASLRHMCDFQSLERQHWQRATDDSQAKSIVRVHAPVWPARISMSGTDCKYGDTPGYGAIVAGVAIRETWQDKSNASVTSQGRHAERAEQVRTY